MKKYIERLAWGTDASFYRMVPKEVLHPNTEQDIQSLIARANKEHRHLTFRAAGTSLSGQAVTDDLLVVCGKKWEQYQVLDDGARIVLQPGIVGDKVNRILRPYGRRFTPDPASIKSAMVGGIVMNNASGMCCGTHENSYRMLDSVRIILADGTILDTGDPKSREDFKASHMRMLQSIRDLKWTTMQNTRLKEKIERKYKIKNVTGLNLLPLLEYEDPFDIIAHLMVGSEGTLAFLSSVTMRTGVIQPYSASALLLYPTTKEACDDVIRMKQTGCLSAAEFFDRKAMQTVENDFPELKDQPEDAGALLIRIDAMSEEELEDKKRQLHVGTFTSDPALVSKYWAMRSGIFPAVGGTREIGTTCLIEDIAFPLEFLSEATLDLQQLFREHNYPDAVIYGHALEGNYHFILNQRFDTPEAIDQYDKMMHAVVNLVVDKYHGSLKAEHGTGRNMAPFVRREWGNDAYELMQRIKKLFDPDNIFSPGVIFNEDPKSYLQHIKPMPEVHPLIDRCIECGFCEVNCVSCGFALSSRQRIVIAREIARLKAAGQKKEASRLEKDYRLIGKDLCAGDGLCQTSCPVRNNVGEYIHYLREQGLTESDRKLGCWVGTHLSSVGSMVKHVLGVANGARVILGKKMMTAICKCLHYGSGKRIPLWTSAIPKPVRKQDNELLKNAAPVPSMNDNPKKVVYFPSCLNQRLGMTRETEEANGKSTMVAMVEVMHKAGYEVIFPENMANLCCGTIWESKGMPDQAQRKAAELELALYVASEQGRWPVVCDQSPCLYRMRNTMQRLQLYEPVEFIDKFVLPCVTIMPLDVTVAVHATCSTRKMGLTDTLVRVAKACARDVLLPEDIGCCGFAGDKGFTHPDLNAWALRSLREQVNRFGATRGFSNSRTCEIGLTLHSGITYENIAVLVNEAIQ